MVAISWLAEHWSNFIAIGISLAALIFSFLRYERERITAKGQLYLSLRSRFETLLEDLPPEYRNQNWDAADPDGEAIAIRYWHQCFDEWYITNRLFGKDKIMYELWTDFYAKAILAGLNHNGLRKVLIKMINANDPLITLMKDFVDDVLVIWKNSHPDGPNNCPGWTCVHSMPPAAPE